MIKKKSGQPFVMLPRDLVRSDAWRSRGINESRFIDFLMIEHLNRGGQWNGELMAPRRQLEDFGIGARYVSEAIDRSIAIGLADCRRGTGRRPSAYTLTWLPVMGNGQPSDRWKHFINPDLTPLQDQEQARSSAQREVATANRSSAQREVTGCFPWEVTKPVATSQGKPQSPKTSTSLGKHLIRKDSIQAVDDSLGIGSGPLAAAAPAGGDE